MMVECTQALSPPCWRRPEYNIRANCRGYCSHYFVLHDKEILEITVVAFSPDMMTS